MEPVAPAHPQGGSCTTTTWNKGACAGLHEACELIIESVCPFGFLGGMFGGLHEERMRFVVFRSPYSTPASAFPPWWGGAP